jgi:hypothetical protein
MSASLPQFQAYFPDGRFYRRVHALPEHRCIFVRNAKAGTSTILLWLHRIHTGDHAFTPEQTIHREHRLPRPGRDVPIETIVTMLGGDAFRFAFVRHPVKRIESAYLDKIAAPWRLHYRAEVREVLGRPQEPDLPVSLEEFVEALEAQPGIEMNPHWRPQRLNLMHPLVEYDVLGRLESFDADLARIRDLAGLPDVPLAVRNVSRVVRSGSLFDGKPDLLRRVQKIYEEDFDLFGYR